MPKMIYRLCEVNDIVKLRAEILRPGLPIEDAIFPGDDEKTTFHFGAFDADQCLCCLTLMLNENDSDPAYQLRGMATAESAQGKGIGKELMMHTYKHLAQNSATQNLWCNARIIAVGFYRKLGWRVVGEEFHIQGVGPHYKMITP